MKKRIGTLYNKPIIEGDINLKTPNEIHKNELKGGTDLSNIPCYYYKIIKVADDEISFDMFFVKNGYYEYVVNAGNYGIFQTNVTNAYIDYTKITAVKLIDIPVVTNGSRNDKVFTFIISGDIVNRTYTTMSKVMEGITKEMIQQQLDTYAIQITKEEYEAMITINPNE